SEIIPNQASMVNTNNKKGFAITIVPFLIVLASYIGAMLISQHLLFSEVKLDNKYKRSALFIGRQTINIIAAIAISLLTASLMYLFNITISHIFFVFYVFVDMLF